MEPEFLYHYTTRDYAQESRIDIEEPGVAAEISDGTHGPGFYALDIAPRETTREELRWECFRDGRLDHPMDGVLVLDPGEAEPPFEHQEAHIWLMAAPAGASISIGAMIVAIGVWNDSSDEWDIVDL
jgi:hypothetical protein